MSDAVAYVEVIGGLDAPGYVLCVGRREASGACAAVEAAYGFGCLEGVARFGFNRAVYGGVRKGGGGGGVAALRAVCCTSARDAVAVAELCYARRSAGAAPLRVAATHRVAAFVDAAVADLCNLQGAVDHGRVGFSHGSLPVVDDAFVRIDAIVDEVIDGTGGRDVAFKCALKEGGATFLVCPRDRASVEAWLRVAAAADAVFEPNQHQLRQCASGLPDKRAKPTSATIAVGYAADARPSTVRRRRLRDHRADFFPGSAASAPPAARKRSVARVYLVPSLFAEECGSPSSAAASSPAPLPAVEREVSGDEGGARLVFVGTGSSAPSTRRAASAILGDWRDSTFLVDCGCGTLAQLRRILWGDPPPGGVLMTTSRNADATLAALSLIWVSHHHLDHSGGLPTVVEAWCAARRRFEKARRDKSNFRAAEALKANGLRKEEDDDGILRGHRRDHGTLTIVAPPRVLRYLRAYRKVAASSSNDEDDDNVRYVELAGPTHRCEVGPLAIASVRVVHCRDAYACVLRRRDVPDQLVFSGDCRPSDALARRATLGGGHRPTTLIHEATFADCDAAHAQRKRHSTSSEALDVGRRMCASLVVLTHFSQRYVSVAFDTSSAVDPRTRVCAAFDGLVVRTSWADDLATASRRAELDAERRDMDRVAKRRARRWDEESESESDDSDGDDDDAARAPGLALGPLLLPAAANDEAPPVPAAPSSRLEVRLAAFYAKFAPARVGDVARIAPLFSRNFAAMNTKLRDKYGASLDGDGDDGDGDGDGDGDSSESEDEDDDEEDPEIVIGASA